MDDEALEKAFEAAYLDLCGCGAVPYDPQILAELWIAFLADLAAGFPSLFAKAELQSFRKRL